jgi:hypothetical protein
MSYSIHVILSPGEAQALYGALEFANNPLATGLERLALRRGLYHPTLESLQNRLAADMTQAGISWQQVGT